MNKLIMIIAGTKWQIPLIKKIHEMGHKVLVVNLYPDSPAFSYADYSEIVDILDKEACLRIAQKYDIDAILSDECDIATPTIAYIAEKLDLIGISQKSASLYTNKHEMRLFGKKNGLNTPDFALCSSIQDVKDFVSSNGLPIIIKPLDSNSSRGVFLINDESELEKRFDETLSYSHVSKKILAEQYINGTEFTIDGVVINNKHYSLAISEKKHYAHNPNIAYELFFTHKNENFDYELLRDTNDKFVNLSKLENGCFTHAEYKYQDGKFYLIEIGARGGGNLISAEIVPIMTGFDNYEYLINQALGTETKISSVDIDNTSERCAVLYFFDTPGNGGVVKKILGTEILKNDLHVLKFELNFKEGDKIEKAKNDAARIGYFIAYEDSKKQLEELICEVVDNFTVEYEVKQ
ncbi:MAG: ATP-grasp domain-containing protein [Treponema sp.]|nr:ATP-grasp domain-containing protein [Treponema sp.]